MDITPETETIMSNLPQDLSNIKKILYLELTSWLPNYNLLKLDKLSGSFGVEARAPYLDHRLVEMIFKAPDKFLWDFVQRKPLIYKVARRWGISRRRKKFPFTYQNSNVVNMKSHLIAIEKHQWWAEAINVSYVRELVKSPTVGVVAQKKIESLFLFSHWLKIYNKG